MYYLAMDGGGTKLVGLLFDDQYRPLATARADGTHLSVYPIEEVRAHVSACYEQLFAGMPRPMHIERLYTICGDSRLYADLLPEGVTLGETRNITEAVSALYAGAGRQSGFVALSGTGSDVFYIKDSRCEDVIGGWGAILGDEGSGVWMARHAMQRAIHAEQGWGPPTRFGEVLMEHYGLTQLWDFVAYVYYTPSPFRRLGEILPLVAKAARDGDEAMLEIFQAAGRILAEQMMAILRRYPDEEPCITACGGAWKAHPAMAEAFTAAITAEFPAATFTLPHFEHIMAGPVCLAMEEGKEFPAALDFLSDRFPELVWNHHG